MIPMQKHIADIAILDKTKQHEALIRKQIQHERGNERSVQQTRNDIPDRYKHVTFENFIASDKKKMYVLTRVKEYADNFSLCLQEGASLIFTGSQGVGKTHLAIALCKAVSAQGYYSYYVNFTQILQQVKDSYRPQNNVGVRQVIEQVGRFKFLVLDEVSIGSNSQGVLTGSEQHFLFQLINYRYEKLLPTLVISNLIAPQLRAVIGNSTWDRLLHYGALLGFNWSSHRTPQNNNNKGKVNESSTMGNCSMAQ